MRSVQDSPLFERQVGNDEYNELQHYRSMIDQMQQRIQRLEHINVDLERRLEDQAKETMALETECIKIERTWKSKCELLENEIMQWKIAHETERTKGMKLREQLSRTEKELYGILQRKYELMRGPAGGGALKPPGKQPSSMIGDPFKLLGEQETSAQMPLKVSI
jgi:predicted RNase H-like nuclease (RuvC/YqgF family)